MPGSAGARPALTLPGRRAQGTAGAAVSALVRAAPAVVRREFVAGALRRSQKVRGVSRHAAKSSSSPSSRLSTTATTTYANDFEATGTMTTTIDGRAYTHPANGT